MYGRTVLSQNTVFPTRVSADGNPKYKAAGITIDWATVTAVASNDAVLPDGSIVKVGQKYLRYGQVMTQETTGSQHTLTGTASGGTFKYTLIRPDTNETVTTAAISGTATAAQVLAAVQAVMGPGQAQSASGGALGTNPVVVTFLTNVALGTVDGTSLTGGTVTPTLTGTSTTGGFFGPYDPSASDGRQTLTRGRCYVLDQTIVQYPSGTNQLSASNDQVGGAIEAGDIFLDRVIQSGTASHTLAAGPTFAEFIAAFPAFTFVQD